MYEDIKGFWSPKTLDEGRHMILPPGSNWSLATEDVLPSLLTPIIKQNVTYDIAAEIGCGIGRLMVPMASLFNKVIGIDISPEMVNYSRDYLKNTKNTVIILTDGSAFLIDSNSIDFVYSVICFQHIPYREMIRRYISETFRILKPFGLARIQTYIGIGTGKYNDNNMWVGYFYPSKTMFATEFENAGFGILESEIKDGYIWITAIKQ